MVRVIRITRYANGLTEDGDFGLGKVGDGGDVRQESGVKVQPPTDFDNSKAATSAARCTHGALYGSGVLRFREACVSGDHIAMRISRATR